MALVKFLESAFHQTEIGGFGVFVFRVLNYARNTAEISTKHAAAKVQQRLNALAVDDMLAQRFESGEEHP